jgi:hypothetical protein
MRITADLKEIFPGQNGFERAASCYDPKLITDLKISYIPITSAVFAGSMVREGLGELCVSGIGEFRGTNSRGR